jgi:hypothetical protein
MARSIDTPDSPYLIEDASDITAGAIDFDEDHLLPPNAAASLLNVETSFGGRRRKRKGILSRGVTGGSGNPNGAARLEDPNADNFIVAHQGNLLHSTDGDGSFTPRATSASLYDTNSDMHQGRGAAFTPTLFIASAVPYTANVSLPYQELFAIDTAWGFTSIDTIRPRALSWYQNRLWAFNSCQTGHGPDFLLWSNVLDGRDFSSAESVQINPEGGDEGIAIVPLRGAQPQILLFKEQSIHRLDINWETDGFYPSSSNALDFTKAQLRPLVEQTGCVATKGLTWVPGLQGADLLFLSREGIRSLNRSTTDAQGGAGLPLSSRIQSTIDRINWDHANKAAAAFWNNVAYFAVPIDGAVNNNYVIAHDVTRGGWSFLDWDSSSWIKSKIDAARKFFFFSNTSGTDGTSTYTNGYHLYETGTGAIDPFGLPIQMIEETRGFTFPENPNDPSSGLGHKKIWRWLELKAQSASTHVTITLQYKVDDNDAWKSLGSMHIDPTDSYPILPVQLPFTFDSGTYSRKQISLHNVPPGYKLALRISDTESFARFKLVQMTVYAHRIARQFDG